MKASMGTTTTEATTMEEVTIANMELDGAMRDKDTMKRLLILLQQLPVPVDKFNSIRNKDALFYVIF